MSGAPEARYLEVQEKQPDGSTVTKRYTIEPRVLSDSALMRLKATMVKRRREQRQQAIRDFAACGDGLSSETKTAFAQAILSDAKQDADIPLNELVGLLLSADEEAFASVLWTCSPEIETFDHALLVVRDYNQPMALAQLINDLLEAEQDSVGNLLSHPEKA